MASTLLHLVLPGLSSGFGLYPQAHIHLLPPLMPHLTRPVFVEHLFWRADLPLKISFLPRPLPPFLTSLTIKPPQTTSTLLLYCSPTSW